MHVPSSFFILARTVFFSFLLVFSPMLLWASDFQSARVVGLGGAGHAAPILTDAIYLTPSYVSFIPTQALSADLLIYQLGQEKRQKDIWNFAVLDGDPQGLFQAGAAYLQRPEARWVHVSAGKRLFSHMSVGVGWKLRLPRGDVLTRAQDVSLSVSGIISPGIVQASLIVDDFFQQTAPRQIALGTQFNLASWANIYVDPHWFLSSSSPANNTLGYSLGLELPIMKDLFLRGGKFYQLQTFQQQRGNGYGLGIGWVAPRLTLDYGFSKVWNFQNATVHQLAFSVYL